VGCVSTFSLLQISLDQTIERDFFIDAAEATESLTRSDLAQAYRELDGIVISNLSHADAVALQDELRRRNFPTEVVGDPDLPILPEEYQVQRMEADGESLRFTDAMGRDYRRPLSDLVFLAGGFATHSRSTSERQIALSPLPRVSRRHEPEFRTAEVKRVYGSEEMGGFRLDFFFWSEPNRLAMSLTDESTFFIQGRACRIKRTAELLEMIAPLRALLPAERRNVGMNDPSWHYPSLRAYFEEIRWHFHQLGKGG
jgi:hypothetical protein